MAGEENYNLIDIKISNGLYCIYGKIYTLNKNCTLKLLFSLSMEVDED